MKNIWHWYVFQTNLFLIAFQIEMFFQIILMCSDDEQNEFSNEQLFRYLESIAELKDIDPKMIKFEISNLFTSLERDQAEPITKIEFEQW